MNNNIEKKLASIKTKDLSTQESANLWHNIWQNRGQQLSWSPFSLLLNNKNMAAILIVFALVFGGSIATVQAANAAKPGDLLFPIDQAVEKIQLAISNNQKREELKIQIATERTEELKQIISEAKTKGDDKKHDENIKTSLNLVAAISDDLNSEASTSTDVKVRGILQKIEDELENLDTPVKLQLKFKGDDKAKFKLEAEEEDDGNIKVHFESKGFNFLSTNTSTTTSTATSTPRGNSEEKIKVCHLVSLGNQHDLKISPSALSAHLAHGDTLGECPEKNKSFQGLSEAEAKIGPTSTLLKYEFNEHNFTLTINSTSTDAIIKTLMEKTGLSEATIKAVLKIETSSSSGKNRNRGNDGGSKNPLLSTSTPIIIDPIRRNDELQVSTGTSNDNDDDHGGGGNDD